MAMFRILVCALFAFALFTPAGWGASLLESLKTGRVDLQSAGSLAFGPEGILFVGDSTSAAVFAIDTGDRIDSQATAVDIRNFGTTVATLLGTVPNQIRVNDIAVNPISKRTYMSLSRGRGAGAIPVIMRVDPAGNFEVLSLENVKHSRAVIPNPSDTGARNQRLQVITDLAFVNSHVYVAGLSNEEFSSNMRRIPFPFVQADEGSSIEIWHHAHGRFETNSPVRTFAPYRNKNVDYVVAAYTCTPLVIMPVSALEPGARVEGVTIAELGTGNSPLDMVVYSREGKNYILLANSSRGVMKISADNLDEIPSIMERPSDASGISYERISYLRNIVQLEAFDSERAIMLEEAGPSLNLKTIALP